MLGYSPLKIELNMPFRCLINPNIGKSLNNKISEVPYDLNHKGLEETSQSKEFRN